jgi:uncharacterized membrane protein
MPMEETTTSTKQPVPYPVSITSPRQERYSRLLALCTLLLTIPKLLILIPQLILLYILSLCSFVVSVIAQFAVLFTGKYPQVLYDFTLGAIRWQTRVAAYIYGITDKYPPFRLDE